MERVITAELLVVDGADVATIRRCTLRYARGVAAVSVADNPLPAVEQRPRCFAIAEAHAYRLWQLPGSAACT